MKKEPPNPQAINPRYKGLRLSDAARILTRPKNPDARKALDRIQQVNRTRKGHGEDR